MSSIRLQHNLAASDLDVMNAMNQNDPSSAASAIPAQPSLIETLGIEALLQMLRRRFLVMAGTGVIAGIVALTYLMAQPATYEATSLVIISPRSEQVIANQQIVGDLPRDSSSIDSEIEMLRSPALAQQLARAYRETAPPNIASTLPRPSAQAGVETHDPLADELASKITVRRRGLTYVIEIIARDQNPERAKLIADTYAQVYITSQVDMRSATAERAGTWLDRRLASMREDLRQKESAVEQFRVSSGLMAASGTSLVEQQITNVQTQVLQAEADLAEREARFQQLRALQSSGSSIDTIGTALNSSTIQSLRDREADIARRQSDLESRYLPTHPAIQSVRAERQDVEVQIQSEIRRISQNLANEVDVARARLRTLQGSLSQVSGELNANSSENVRLRELEREAAASRGVYEAYLQRYEEIADQDQLNTSDARLLTLSRLPVAPASPQLKMALLLAVGIGLILGLGAGVAAELFDQSVKNADDLESRVGAPAITSVPTISKRMMRLLPPSERSPAGYLVSRPMSAFTEALRVLRTIIVYSKIDLSTRVVAITSATPNEGKTTISICLARVAAMSGQKVVVVDCDLRKQSINDIVDVDTEVGILHVLAGEATWRDAIVRDTASGADVLPVATPTFTPLDVFGSEGMAKLIQDLRAEYDLVILDCAPILAVADTRVIVKQADAVVVVARAGKSAAGAVRAAVMQSQAVGGNVIGVAINCVQPHWQSYGDSIYFYQSKSYYSVS